MTTPRLLLMGASGRMGSEIVRQLADAASAPLRLTGAVASRTSGSLGRDVGTHAGISALNVSIDEASCLPALLANADVAIDFSNGAAVGGHLAECVRARVPLLIGTTGAPESLAAQIDAATRSIAVLVAANTSLGVNVLLALVREAARALPYDYDIEIVETHHRHKLDAPSGTALALGEAAAQGRDGATLSDRAITARAGVRAARQEGQIGIASLRGGDVVGEHQVWLLGAGESLGLVHRVTDRAVFARGAVQAAAWLAGRTPGRYGMRDFL